METPRLAEWSIYMKIFINSGVCQHYKASVLLNIEEVLFLARQWVREGNRMEMLEVGILSRYS